MCVCMQYGTTKCCRQAQHSPACVTKRLYGDHCHTVLPAAKLLLRTRLTPHLPGALLRICSARAASSPRVNIADRPLQPPKALVLALPHRQEPRLAQRKSRQFAARDRRRPAAAARRRRRGRRGRRPAARGSAPRPPRSPCAPPPTRAASTTPPPPPLHGGRRSRSMRGYIVIRTNGVGGTCHSALTLDLASLLRSHLTHEDLMLDSWSVHLHLLPIWSTQGRTSSGLLL